MMRTPRRPERSLREAGSLLILAVLFLAFALSAVVTTLGVISERTRSVRMSRSELVARTAAESGVHQVIAQIKTVRDMSTMADPFRGIDTLDTNPVQGPGGYTQFLNGQVLLDTAGNSVAEYDVFVDSQASGDARILSVSCQAYIPSKAAFAAGVRDAVRKDANCTIRLRVTNAHVFDYAYFINHWGWFFGNNIVANGNARSNGQFDFGGYASTVNGSPRYSSAEGTDLQGYLDDNHDGILDGSDGGAYSGFRIADASNVRGMGGEDQNQHAEAGILPMPNLSDLTWYEKRAIEMGASIKIGSTTYVNGVLGDQPAEKRNLYLVGTEQNPIVLNGPVVVRGSVILSGYVTGRGTIYSGQNIYVAKDLIMKNPPTTWRPSSNDEATVEAWLRDNQSKDALGLYAKEHIVIGNYTDLSWQSNVQSWVESPMNKSIEDAGMDQVHNTRSGPDGILGTADDDVLEGDGRWTVSYYTAEDAARGLIPEGFAVGDPIPGSGEDIDGDGKRDNATQMCEFNIPCSLQSSLWASNNLSSTPIKYESISTLNIKRIDGVLYTNHTLAALMINWAGDIVFNGAVVSRNEAIIYGARNLILNHDERLTGRDGDFYNLHVPKCWEPIEILQWEYDLLLPSEGVALGNPASIARYYTGFTKTAAY